MHNRNRGLGRVVFLVLTLALLTAGRALAAGDGPRNIMLSWTGPAETTQTIAWQSGPETLEGYVVYAPTADLTGGQAVQAQLSYLANGDSHFEATLTGLSPDSTYYYTVGDDRERSQILHFTTAQQDTEEFTFLYMGDIQVDHDEEEEYAMWGQLLQQAYARHPGIRFALQGGDIVESGSSMAQWELFLQNASPVFSQIPLMPTNGNHESNFLGGKPNYYLDVFALPENGPEGFVEEFYSFDYGNCHVTVVNTHVFSGEQNLDDGDYALLESWIAEDLAGSSATWNFVVMHHPAYALATDLVSAQVLENWAPLFEAGGVDVVFCGHQHVYSRSYPLTGSRIDYEDGVTYIMGNAGQKHYSTANETFSQVTIYETTNYQIVRVSGDSLELVTYDAEGNALDYWSTTARDKGETPPEAYFTDVSPDDWFYEAVGYGVEAGLFTGTGGGAFSPEGDMTRAMFVTVVGRMAGIDDSGGGDTGFADVDPEEWYAPYVAWAETEGIVEGVGDGRFDPEGQVTREQMVTMFHRYLAGMDLIDEVEDTGLYDGFSDSADTSDWAVIPMVWAAETGAVTGNSDGSVNPLGRATRAEAAQLVYNLTGTVDSLTL